MGCEYRLQESNIILRKPILIDILNILVLIKKYQTSEEIDTYIIKALTDGRFERKTIKHIELML